MGPLELGAPCRAWAVQTNKSDQCQPMQLPSPGASRSGTLLLGNGCKTERDTKSSGRSTLHLAPCVLGEQQWRGKVNGQGVQVGANAEHRLGCVWVWVGSETDEAFFSKVSQFQRFTLLPGTAAPQQLFVNRPPLYALVVVAVVNFRTLSRAQQQQQQQQPSGKGDKCTAATEIQPQGGAGFGLDASVSVCTPVGRVLFGELELLVSQLKASQPVSQQMMTAGGKNYS